MPTLLVTGHSGFVGSRLIAAQAELRHHAWQVRALPAALDLRDARAVRDALGADPPDAVIHLAALTSVARSFQAPDDVINVNLLGTLHLLQALEAARFAGRMLYVSSGDVYGVAAETSLPIGEGEPLRPRSPYAVSKIAAETLCGQWVRTHGADIVIARPFNHIGPGQSEQFVVAGFARQVAEIAAGRRPPRMATGDLAVTRDFLDVGDVIAAYLALLDQGRRGEIYNVASGVERRIGDVLARLVELADTTVEIATDPALLRPGEQRRMAGDAGRLRADTGWEPRIPFDRSLADILNYWKHRIDHG